MSVSGEFMNVRVLLVILLCCAAVNVEARLTVTGHGSQVNFSRNSIPDKYKASFDLMQKKCTICHSMEHTVIAITTGRAPVTGQLFTKQAAKAYGIKMLRKPNSGMDRKEVLEVVTLLNFLMDENSK